METSGQITCHGAEKIYITNKTVYIKTELQEALQWEAAITEPSRLSTCAAN